MAGKATTPAAVATKRMRTTSPSKEATTEAKSTTDEPAAQAVQADELSEDDDVEADDGYDSESTFRTDKSDSTSLSSSIYQGYVENGRRYQSKCEGEYWGPSDEKQFESLQACHILHLILDSKAKNNLFYSPIPDTVQNILDIGTGIGAWAVEAAERYPSAFVQGVDLSPPPDNWVPPNCKFEVDDILRPWVFNKKFELIHMRYMFGAFTDEQWRLLYIQAYENLAPGGWIEQLEPSVNMFCDDDTLPGNSLVSGWGPMFVRCCAKTGKHLDTTDTFKSRIEAAGFTNIHEKTYKVPIGEWTKDPLLKEAGKFQKMQLLSGLEGYAMFILTHFGEPEPWTADEVQVYLAKVRNEINSGYHIYCPMRRVWAQKPYDVAPKIESKVEVGNLS